MDEDYDTEIRACKGAFSDFIDTVRLRAQDIVKERISAGQGQKNCRFKAEDPVQNQGEETQIICYQLRSRIFRPV